MKFHFSYKSLGKSISLMKKTKSILLQPKKSIYLSQNNLQKNLNDSSKRLSLNLSTLPAKKSKKKIVNPEELVYDSPFLQIRPKDYISLCQDLKSLQIRKKTFSQIKNDLYDDDYDEDFDFLNMNNNLKLNDTINDYNNVVEILEIIKKVEIPPEKRKMKDLFEIVKYLTTTKLGAYFKEGFEQKEIFEKLITFCGVEIRYKFFKKGETIFRIGDLPDNFYIILLGKVDVLKPFPEKMLMTGYQYFCYLMQLKKSKDEHLINLCIKENKNHFRIDIDDVKDLKYIYIYIMLDLINRRKIVNFDDVLKLVNISHKEFDLDPDKLNDPKYIFENIKKIKIYLPDIPTSILSKYLFFKEIKKQKEVTVFNYSSFLTLDTKSHFGDSAMDSNTTRNATIAAIEDTHTAYISCSSYFHNVVVEKAALIDKKVQFLNTNFIFGKIHPKMFEQKYFGLFIEKNYKKGDIIYHEGDLPLYVYFIEKGDVELSSSKNIFELQNVIEYLEQQRFQFMKRNNNDEEKFEGKDYIYTYSKMNLVKHDLRKEIVKNEINKIVLLKENEDLGLLSFYFGYPYLATSTVSSATAKIYQIDNKYLSEIILKEKACYNDLINRVENKLYLLHERFFSINNTKLLLADHQKSMDSKRKRNTSQNFDTSNNYIKNKNINDSKENSYSLSNQKNNFNKTYMKINYEKLKKVYTRLQKSNINHKNTQTNFHEKNKNKNITNYLQKSNLPVINLQKSSQISNNNISTDKTISIKIKTQEQINEGLKSSSNNKKSGSKNILIKKNIFKNTSVTKAISKKKNINFSDLMFRNNSCIFLEEKKFCIDPVLKKSYEDYEKMYKNKLNIKRNKNKSSEEHKIQSLYNKIPYDNEKKFELNDIKSSNNNYNYNNSISCKSKSYSRNITKILFGQKDEEKYKNKKVSTKLEHIKSYNDKGTSTKIIRNKKINHPYFSPLVLMKKELYEVFKTKKPLKKDLEIIKNSKKSKNNKKDFS